MLRKCDLKMYNCSSIYVADSRYHASEAAGGGFIHFVKKKAVQLLIYCLKNIILFQLLVFNKY